MAQGGNDGELVELLYAAAGEPKLWTQFLSHLAVRLKASGAGFMVHHPREHQYGIDVSCQLPIESFPHYAAYYGAIDPWFRSGTSRPEGMVALGSSLCSPSAFRETEFYNDFLSKYDFFYQCGVTLESSNGNRTVLSLLRTNRQPDFGDSDIRLLTDLVPHLRRALSLHRKMIDLRQTATASLHALDSFDTGIVGVQADGTVSFTNQKAEAILRTGHFFTQISGKLCCKESAQQYCFKELLHSAASPSFSRIPGGLILRHGKQLLYVSVFPYCSQERVLLPRPMALLILSDPEARPQSRDQLLKSFFRLSPAEVRLSMLLMQGLEVNEIADQTRTTVGTVRFRLKEIYKKTGVKRQSRLIRLLSQLPGHP